MAIYYMNSKTFFKTFLESEDPDKIISCQYVIISQSIRRGRTDDFKKLITVGSRLLYPTDKALAIFQSSKDHMEFIDEYWEQLNDYGKNLLVTLVRSVIEQDYTIILLCTKKDSRFGFMELIAEWVAENLKYPIYDYALFKSGKQKVQTYNPSWTLKECKRLHDEIQKSSWKRNIKTKHGRKKLVSGMSKKEKIKLLKEMNLYSSDMTKKDLDEMIDLFFVQDD